MDNRKIDPAVYEKFVDASTALMLEYYSAHHEEPLSALPEDGIEFPAALDARCRADLQAAVKKHRRKNCARRTLKIFGSVACAFLVTLGLASMLIMSVDAFRIPVLNYLASRSDQYVQITDQNKVVSTPIPFDFDDPLNGLLPEGYTLTMSNRSETHSTLMAIYDASETESVLFDISSTGAVSRFDAEGAQEYREFTLNGYDAILIVKDPCVTVIWINEELHHVYTIITNAMDKEQTLDLATEVAIRLDDAFMS